MKLRSGNTGMATSELSPRSSRITCCAMDDSPPSTAGSSIARRSISLRSMLRTHVSVRSFGLTSPVAIGMKRT